MNALRIRKRLVAPVPGFPELSPLLGRTVEIIVLLEPDAEDREEVPSASQAPRPTQRVRVAGRVESADGAGAVFSLRLDTGDVLRVRWGGAPPSPVRQWTGQRVVVDAGATFSDAGPLLDFAADAISPAREADAFFSRVPEPVGRRQTDSELRRLQTPMASMAQAFGAWPGDESDEEVLQALEEVE